MDPQQKAKQEAYQNWLKSIALTPDAWKHVMGFSYRRSNLRLRPTNA